MAVLAAVLVAMSAPGLAVAHGSAHQAASNHPHGDGLAATQVSSGELEVETAEHGAHAHPAIGAAVTSRPHVPLFVPTSGPAMPGAVSADFAAPTFDAIGAVPVGPSPRRSRQPRAPPLG